MQILKLDTQGTKCQPRFLQPFTHFQAQTFCLTLQTGANSQNDCAAFAAAKPVQMREKDKAHAKGEMHTHCTVTPVHSGAPFACM